MAGKKNDVKETPKKMKVLVHIQSKVPNSHEMLSRFDLVDFGEKTLVLRTEEGYTDSFTPLAMVEDTKEHQDAVWGIRKLLEEQRRLYKQFRALEAKQDEYRKLFGQYGEKVPSKLLVETEEVQGRLGLNMRAVADAFRILGVEEPVDHIDY
jgi:hypothetical protein